MNGNCATSAFHMFAVRMLLNINDSSLKQAWDIVT